MEIFFLVLARDEEHLEQKIKEIEDLGVPYVVVCGKNLDIPNVVYRPAKGKYDAINFGFNFVPPDIEVVALCDVDTQIMNFEAAKRPFSTQRADLVFASVNVAGPQNLFYGFLDGIRKYIPIAASGELMLIKRDLLKKILPLKPCKAEDSYILFKALELKKNCFFCRECFVKTERTRTAEKEEAYKRKTVSGIYQALSYTNPPYYIQLFYAMLPFLCSMLIITGDKGYFWAKGILVGFTDYLRGDKSGTWETAYMG